MKATTTRNSRAPILPDAPPRAAAGRIFCGSLPPIGALLCALLAGCAATEKFSEGREFVVRKETDFFRSGPAQAAQPEKLPTLEFLKVESKDPAYAFVRLGDGRTGYVSSEDIAPAPPTARPVPLDPEPEVIIEPELPDFTAVPDELPSTPGGELKKKKK